jgi:hypothetical protein
VLSHDLEDHRDNGSKNSSLGWMVGLSKKKNMYTTHNIFSKSLSHERTKVINLSLLIVKEAW